MDPISAIGGMMTSRIAAISQIAAVRMLRDVPGTDDAIKELVGAAQQNVSRLANLADGVGRNLDISV